MKFMWMAAMVFCGGMLMAGTDIDVNGKFAGSTIGAQNPKGWSFNTSISPVGTGKVVQAGDELGVQISNPQKEVAYYSRNIDVKAGDKFELSCDMTGTGKGGMAIYFYNAKGWVGLIYSPVTDLKPGKNELEWEVVIPAELRGKNITRACFVFRVIGKAEITVTDFEVEKEDVK